MRIRIRSLASLKGLRILLGVESERAEGRGGGRAEEPKAGRPSRRAGSGSLACGDSCVQDERLSRSSREPGAAEGGGR